MCELLGEELQEGRLAQGQRQTEVFCTMEAVSMPRFSLGSQRGVFSPEKWVLQWAKDEECWWRNPSFIHTHHEGSRTRWAAELQCQGHRSKAVLAPSLPLALGSLCCRERHSPGGRCGS